MKSKISLLFIIFYTFISCNEKEPTKQNDDADLNSNTFNVIVNATVEKDDKMMLYFQDETIGWFDDDHFVEQSVVGKQNNQRIVFTIPEGYLPTNLRLDLSSVSGQKPIHIKNVILKYQSKNLVIDGANFLSFFSPNDYIDFDDASNTATFIVKEDKSYDPILLPKDLLAIEVANMTKK